MSHFQCVTEQEAFYDHDPLKEPEFFAARYRDFADVKALELLYQAFRHLIFSICFKILRNRHDAEDVTNDLYIVLHEKLKEHEVENFPAWLSRTVRFKCYNIIRDRGRERDRFEKFKIEAAPIMESGHNWGHIVDRDKSTIVRKCKFSCDFMV